MKFFKSCIFVLTFVLFTVSSVCFAEGLSQNVAGEWTYETTISSLVNRRVYEEIKLINNSSYPLSHITCTITINGKNHDMRPMPVLKLSDSEGFDGYYEDDMNREFPKFFGKDGKFSRKNDNIVKITLKFRNHADDIVITDVYDQEEDLCFVIEDDVAPVQDNQSVSVAPVIPGINTAAPVQQQNVAPQNNNSGDTTVVIDGKTYLIHDGKAYPIQ